MRTFRTECLDHIIVMNERHIHVVLREFIDYYNRERPHRTLGTADAGLSLGATGGEGRFEADSRQTPPRL